MTDVDVARHMKRAHQLSHAAMRAQQRVFNPVIAQPLTSELPAVAIWTDGSCWPNPGPGGWAAIVRYADRPDIELSGFDPTATNNRMEIMGAIAALDFLPEPHRATIGTDSRYLINGITKWLPGWKRHGWVNFEKQPVANRDLWERLDVLCKRHSVTWKKVKGHSGNPENERCDFLAGQARAAGKRS